MTEKKDKRLFLDHDSGIEVWLFVDADADGGFEVYTRRRGEWFGEAVVHVEARKPQFDQRRSEALHQRRAERRGERPTRDITWLRNIEALKPGDACDFQWPARKTWHRGEVIENGRSGLWRVKLTESYVDEETGRLIDAGTIANSLYIEMIRMPGDVKAWPP